MTVAKRYLGIPVSREAKIKKMRFLRNGDAIYEIDAQLDAIEPHDMQYLDMGRFLGQELEVSVEPEMDVELLWTDSVPDEGIYTEKYRPAVHFTARRGWINDPNGLFWLDGEYHMYFQHNPAGTGWGNMHWGHAVSRDLIHWTQLDEAMFPDENGMMFSGSAFVDHKNVSGMQSGEKPPVLFFYTAAGGISRMSEGGRFTQRLAVSRDGGGTVEPVTGEPILPWLINENRDPKVVRVPETGGYLMVLYLTGHRYGLFSSKNLLSWTKQQELDIPDDRECPNIVRLPLDGDKRKMFWVISGACDRYLVGRMQNGLFKVTQPAGRLHYGSSSYAAQSFDNMPGGRTVRMAWNTSEAPESVFNNSMCVPTELSLRTIDDQYMLCAWPVEELDALRRNTTELRDIALDGDNTAVLTVNGKAHDILLEAAADSDGYFEIELFGMTLRCDAAQNRLAADKCDMPLYVHDRHIRLRMIADSLSVEIFADQGQAFMCVRNIADYNLKRIRVSGRGVKILSLRHSELENIWTKESAK